MTEELDRNHCIHGRPQKICQDRDNVEILLILFRLLTMQCKWTFTNRFTQSRISCTPYSFGGHWGPTLGGTLAPGGAHAVTGAQNSVL